MRKFRIICLKRTHFADSNQHDFQSDWWKHCDVCYWGHNRSGYTYKWEEAGIYTSLDLNDCAGDGFDWFAIPLYRSEKNEV